MKYAATTLMGLLLLGVCSARMAPSRTREMDVSQYREADYTNLAQGSRREGAQYKAEQQNTQQWSQLRETVTQGLKKMRQSTGNSHQVFPPEPLPKSIYVGNVSDKYAALSIEYTNVTFNSVSSGAIWDELTNAYPIVVNFVVLDSAMISGNYTLHNRSRTEVGTFNYTVFGGVSFQSIFPYNRDGDNVTLIDTSGQLYYDYATSFYNSSELPDFVEQGFRTALLRKVNEKVHAELRDTLSATVIADILQNWTSSGYRQADSVDKVLRNGIHNVVNGIQRMLAEKGFSSIELTGDDREMVYNKLHAKIASVKLNGFHKFYLADNQVSKESSNKISAKVQLAIDRPTASALVTIKESQDENAPFQKINVDFDIEKLMAELMFEKATRQSGLNLSSFQTKVNRIRPTNAEKFQGEVRDLIKEKLADHMKHYVEHALDKVIMNEYFYFMNRGALSSSQENRFTQKQM